MSKLSARLAAFVTAGVLTLTGCASGNPQVAAYVGAAQISQAQVDAVSRVLAETSSDPTDTVGGFAPTVMSIMVQSELVRAAASAKGLSVSDADRQAFYATNDLYQLLLANPASADFMKRYADTAVLLGTDAGKAAFQEAVDTITVRVNPRFGEWDPANGLVQGSSGSLSEAAAIPQE